MTTRETAARSGEQSRAVRVATLLCVGALYAATVAFAGAVAAQLSVGVLELPGAAGFFAVAVPLIVGTPMALRRALKWACRRDVRVV